MLRLLGLLLVLWLVVSVVGAVIEGLFWLTVVGLILVGVTAVLGWNKRSEISNRR
jgi:hypothetical protein